MQANVLLKSDVLVAESPLVAPWIWIGAIKSGLMSLSIAKYLLAIRSDSQSLMYHINSGSNPLEIRKNVVIHMSNGTALII